MCMCLCMYVCRPRPSWPPQPQPRRPSHVAASALVQTKSVHVAVYARIPLHVHTHTHARAWQAAAALRLASRELRACDGCIRAGCPLACCIQEIGKPCNQCAEVGRKCTYLFAPMSCCDQGSGQRKACEQLTAAFDSDHTQWEEETGCDVKLARPLYGSLHDGRAPACNRAFECRVCAISADWRF